MKAIESEIRWPAWITPRAKYRINHEIQFFEKYLKDELSPMFPEQVGREAAAALEAIREVRKRIRSIIEIDARQLVGRFCVRDTGEKWDRWVESIEDEEYRRAIHIGFDLRLGKAALIGMEQKMVELEEVCTPERRGRKQNFALNDAASVILGELETIPGVDVACRQAFMDHIFGLIQARYPETQQPSLKTISRHRERVRRQREKLKALSKEADWTE